MELTDAQGPRGRNTGQIVVGLIVVGIGLLFLADRYLDRDVSLVRSWWPLIPIVMGVARVASAEQDARGRSHRRSGVWLIMIGLWALVSDSHLFGFSFNTSWPLLVIGAGVMIVWRSFEPRCERPVRREP